jgi:hypothetical protein
LKRGLVDSVKVKEALEGGSTSRVGTNFELDMVLQANSWTW